MPVYQGQRGYYMNSHGRVKWRAAAEQAPV